MAAKLGKRTVESGYEAAEVQVMPSVHCAYLVFSVEDLYGTQQPLALLKFLMERRSAQNQLVFPPESSALRDVHVRTRRRSGQDHHPGLPVRLGHATARRGSEYHRPKGGLALCRGAEWTLKKPSFQEDLPLHRAFRVIFSSNS